MTRQRKILTGLGAAAGAVLLLLGLLFYTPPGLGLVARLVTPLSGGAVRVIGLGGFFPNHLTAARVTVADEQGVWLTVEDVDLHWSALSALFSHIAIDDARARRVAVLRRPVPSDSSGESPVIDIAHLSVPRIDLSAQAAGHAASVSAQGTLHYVSRHDLSADLTVARLDTDGAYRIDGGVIADVAHGRVTIREGADGILGTLLGLPGLGPVNVQAQAHGDARGNVIALAASLGDLAAVGQGTIQLAAQRADIDFQVKSPAMAPRPDLSWQALAAQGHFHGTFDKPQIDAHFELTDAKFAGIAATALTLDAQGSGGAADVKGVARHVTIPGEQPDLFAGAPVTLEVHADLAARDRPVRFAVTHPLARLTGQAATRGGLSAQADIAIPALAPFVANRRMDLSGSGRLHLTASQSNGPLHVGLEGTLDAKGSALAARLLGHAELAMQAVIDGSDIQQSRLTFKGRGVSSELAGTLKKGVLAYRASVSLSDLSRLVATLHGRLSLQGTINGAPGEAEVKASGAAMMAATGFPLHRIGLDLAAKGLPPSSARLSMNGNLNDGPLRLVAALAKSRQVTLNANWKSLEAGGALTLADDKRGMHGDLHLAVAQLDDLSPFAGSALSGALETKIVMTASGRKSDVAFDARLSAVKAGGAQLGALTVEGNAADLFGKPVLTASAKADGLAVAGFAGGGTLKTQGPISELQTDLDLNLTDSGGVPATLSASAVVQTGKGALTLTAAKGQWRGAPLSLDGPATLAYGDGLAVDHLSVHLGGGTITASGMLSPELAFTAQLRNVKLEEAPLLMPSVGPRGLLSADANLSGTLAAPSGTISLKGEGLHAAATGKAVPPADMTANITLAADHAQVDAAIHAGDGTNLSLTGRAPLGMDQAMDMRAKGSLDLALFNPLLSPQGRRARGVVTIDAAIGGTPDNPRVTGGAELADGEVQDYARGIRVSAIASSLKAEGTRLVIEKLTGKAGPGSISGSGSIDLAAPGMPVALAFTAANARPMVSDLFTATLNGDLALKGQLAGDLTLSGKTDIQRGEINLPESFPPEVAVLNVRRRGQSPPPKPSTTRIALDVNVSASGPIFVRGHGMDAVMGGEFHLTGTTAVPQISGGFRLVRGTYSVAGQTLNFTSGRVTFDGTGVRHRLDPSLDFTASTTSGGVTATLTITGYASAPKIALSSSPPLPQDEIVAHLLFQQSVKQLSPLQLASIAQALAAMGGVGGGFDALGSVRRTLGLDRLSVGSSSAVGSTGSGTESQTTVEAGRYVSNGVYVGVKQGLAGGTQTQVQVDITDRLKAQATVSAGANPTASGTAARDYGGSVGLSYQLEY
ncbi:MAG: translocation/assembly module TamB domain-containing protein [Alphaproteobacteria bacterium]|nr:translocation/assembly module TamB domain-containing protein [Alphaproteobacteria bacterium]